MQKSLFSKAFFVSDCSFRLVAKFGKRFRVAHGELGEHLTVQRDPRNFQPVHKFGIRETVEVRACVDTGDPKSSHVAFSVLSANIGIIERLHDRFARDPVILALAAEIALGKLHYFSAFFNAVYASFNTHRVLPPLILVGNHLLDVVLLRRGNERRLT